MDTKRPTRDEIELAIWRVTGTRHASEVDRLLAMVDAYAAQPEQAQRMSVEEEEHLFSIMGQVLEEAAAAGELATSESAAQPLATEGGKPSDEGLSKKCSLCQEVKPYAAFSSDRTAKTGKRSRCRTCESSRKQ